jgi:pseudaminic acid cytidylyltransferase
MTIAIIPARAGSKRIRNKNIKNFISDPIIGLTIKKLKLTKLFKKIVVTSDSQKILNIADKYGADILIKRSKKLSDDRSPTEPVILDAINKLDRKLLFDNVCCVYPCNPFLDIKDLKKALNLLIKFGDYFIFPLCRYSHPIQRAIFLNKKKEVKYYSRKYLKCRTQDLNSYFYDAGQFYLARKEVWKNKNKKSKAIIIPSFRCHDIDTTEDWLRAETYYKSFFMTK